MLLEREKQLKKVNKATKDQLTILRQEFRMLGKRPISDELTEDTEVEEAVAREVKRRRLRHHVTKHPHTL